MLFSSIIKSFFLLFEFWIFEWIVFNVFHVRIELLDVINTQVREDIPWTFRKLFLPWVAVRLCSGWGTGFLSYLKIAFQRFTFPVPLFRPDSSNGRTQPWCVSYEVNSCKLVVSFDKSFFAVGISVRVRFGALIIKNFGYEKESDNRFPSCGRILIVPRVCVFGRTCVQPFSTGSCNRVRTLPTI